MLSSENQSEEQNEWGTGRERKFQVPEVQYRQSASWTEMPAYHR